MPVFFWHRPVKAWRWMALNDLFQKTACNVLNKFELSKTIFQRHAIPSFPRHSAIDISMKRVCLRKNAHQLGARQRHSPCCRATKCSPVKTNHKWLSKSGESDSLRKLQKALSICKLSVRRSWHDKAWKLRKHQNGPKVPTKHARGKQGVQYVWTLCGVYRVPHT